MTRFTFSDAPKVDGVHWPLALYFNEYEDALEALAQAMGFAEFVETATLTGNRTLTDADAVVLLLDPGTADREITLPAEASTNPPFFMRNTDDTYKLTIKNDGGTIIDIVYPGEAVRFLSNATDWRVMTAKRDQTDYIKGLRLTWVSTTALNVETGAAYIPSLGRVLKVSATINKTGLSLSASTWYHVYLYESSGAPAVEVVTTAPAAAYFGMARAKTGDTSRRYLGSVLTDGSSNLYKFFHDPQRGLVHWLDTNQTASPFRVLPSGTSSSAASVAMTGCAPTTAIAVALQIYSTGDKVLRVGNSSSLSSTAFSVFLTAGSVADKFVTAEIPVDGSGNIYYKFDSAVGSGNAVIDCYGYIFER